jgi:hypothetical protein
MLLPSQPLVCPEQQSNSVILQSPVDPFVNRSLRRRRAVQESSPKMVRWLKGAHGPCQKLRRQCALTVDSSTFVQRDRSHSFQLRTRRLPCRAAPPFVVNRTLRNKGLGLVTSYRERSRGTPLNSSGHNEFLKETRAQRLINRLSATIPKLRLTKTLPIEFV